MMENQCLVGIGRMEISSDPNAVLIAPNLGSCLGIAVYDFQTHLAGMVHCLLPLSKSDPTKAAAQPSLYVDTGFALLLNHFVDRGISPRNLRIVVVGGANINDENNVFEIGKKNYTVLKKMLWKNNLTTKAEDIGSNVSRTLALYVSSGMTTLKVNGKVTEL